MKELFGGLLGLLLLAAATGLFIAAVVWTFYNVWLVLGIFAVILVLLIIYGMMTSENEGVSSISRLVVTAIVGYVLYVMFN